MAIRRYLAMTAAEMREASSLPSEIGWMACHFSPYGTGLSNLPKALPAGSLLILDDITPIHLHDPEQIAAQLSRLVATLDASGVLLDFQHPGESETARLAEHLIGALPCPVAVSEPYANNLSAPVFLPPVAHHVPLAEYLSPWQGREIWLEMALDRESIMLTEQGAAVASLPSEETVSGGFPDKNLHCHYKIEMSGDTARFTLWRDPADLKQLLDEAEELGVTTAVGLYQELKAAFPLSRQQEPALY